MNIRDNLDFIRIEPDKHGGNGFDVYGFGYYEETSVLAGQTRKVFLKSFDTIEEAKQEYPSAEHDGNINPAYNVMPSNPPAWFDESVAGERWDEDY